MSLLKKIANRILWQLPPSGTISGYENPELVELVFAKAKAFRKSERTSWPELAGFSSVLDFGGGCG